MDGKITYPGIEGFDDIKTKRQPMYEDIEAEIKMHQTRILELKSIKNLIAPISTLPEELLCEIFAYVEWNHRQSGGLISWVVVVNLCKQWRNTAISCSRLWTTLPKNNLEFATLVVKRSKGRPLTLAIRDPPHSWQSPFPFHPWTYFAPRIKCLDIQCLDHSTPLYALPDSMPAIQELILAGKSNHEHDLPLRVPNRVLSDCPQLKSLTLRYVPLIWISTLLKPSLVELTIDRSQDLSRPPATQFREAFMCMPHLKSIQLTNAGPGPHSGNPTEPVYLRCLQSLAVIDSFEGINTTLLILTHPPLSSLLLEFNGIATPAETAALPALLSQRSPLLSDNIQDIRTIRCSERQRFQATLYGSICCYHDAEIYYHPKTLHQPSTLTYEPDPNSGTSRITISSRFSSNQDIKNGQVIAMKSMFRNLLSHLPNIQSLESLALISPRSLSNNLGNLSNNHTISVGVIVVPSLLSTLGLKSPDSPQSVEQATANSFRQLRTLSLEGANFSTSSQPTPCGGESFKIYTGDFKRWLAARAEMGIGLQNLVLCCHGVDGSWIKVVRGIVPIVDVI